MKTLDRLLTAAKMAHAPGMVKSGSELDHLYERLFCEENKLIPRHFVGKGTRDISESNLTQEQTRSVTKISIFCTLFQGFL